MNNRILKSMLLSTFLVSSGQPGFAMKAEQDGEKTPAPARKEFEICTKFSDGPEGPFTRASKILAEKPDHLESLLELYDVACSFLESENSDYQSMALEAFARLTLAVDEESQPLKNRLRISWLLAGLTISKSSVLDYDASLRYTRMIVNNKERYNAGGLLWVLDTIAESEEGSFEQKKKAYKLAVQYAQRIDPHKLPTLITQYIKHLKTTSTRGKSTILKPLETFQDYVEKYPSYSGHFQLAKLYEFLYGLQDHKDEDGNWLDSSITREAYKTAAQYYPEVYKKAIGFSSTDIEEGDVLSLIGDNSDVFFKDPFEFYIFVMKVFQNAKEGAPSGVALFSKWLTDRESTDITEEGQIFRFLYTSSDTIPFAEGSYGAFIAEGIRIARMPEESKYNEDLEGLKAKINDIEAGIEKAKVKDPKGEKPLAFGKRWRYWSWDRWRYEYAFKSVAAAESKLAELRARQANIHLSLEKGEMRTPKRKERKTWLDSQDVEVVYELTRVYKLWIQNDCYRVPFLLQDYQLILESLAEREHPQGIADLAELQEKM